MQNIRGELDAREMEAWQNLIRVHTHEIMNSVSPIISLSETMHRLLRESQPEAITSNVNIRRTLDCVLDAIRVRSEGLYNFTQSYRKLTRISKLSLQNTNTADLIGKAVSLMENTLQKKRIELTVNNANIPIVVDSDLMQAGEPGSSLFFKYRLVLKQAGLCRSTCFDQGLTFDPQVITALNRLTLQGAGERQDGTGQYKVYSIRTQQSFVPLRLKKRCNLHLVEE